MDQQPLRRSAGTVTFEFLLSLPLCLLVLGFALQAERALRERWVALEAARFAVWSYQTLGELPVNDRPTNIGLLADPRTRSVIVSPSEPQESVSHLLTDLESSVGSLASFLGLDWDMNPRPVVAEAVSDISGAWAQGRGQCYLDATTWSVTEMRLRSGDFAGLGDYHGGSAVESISH